MTHEEAREIYNLMITPCNETAYDSDTESDIRWIAYTITDAVAAAFEECAVYAEAILEQGTGYHPGCPNTLAEVIHEDTCRRIIEAIRARGAEGKEG